VGVAVLKVAVHEVGVVILELLSQHLSVQRRVHAVLYDTHLLSVGLPSGASQANVLNLHLQYNLLGLRVRSGGGGR
jgi:hypothetical protein